MQKHTTLCYYLANRTCLKMQWIFVFVLFTFTCTLISPSNGFESDVEEAIDNFVENYFVPIYNITGFGLAIVKYNDQTPDIMVKGYKFRDVENQIEADEKTLFAIGSVTKSFTATVVVKTLSEMYPELGESVLDTPIRVLLPNMNFMLSDRFRSESTSFRDLLAHRTCLYPAEMAWLLGGYENKDELLYRLRYAEEVCPFRTNYVYNNGAYLMAGEIIAQMANSTYEDMLTNFLRELGMNDSRLVQESDDFDSIPNMSRCYYSDNGVIKRYNSNLLKVITIGNAAGGILSTPEDMIKYMQFHLNNGKVGDSQVVSEVAIKYLRHSSNPIPAMITKTSPGDTTLGYHGYGLGLVIGLLDGWEAIAHDGNLPPYYGYMSFYPALKLGIYSVANGPTILDESLFLHKIIYDIIENGLRRYEFTKNIKRQPISNPNPRLPKVFKTSRSIKNIVELVKAEDIIGLYGHGLEGVFTVSELNNSSDGSLYINYGTWGTGHLRQLSETHFAVDWDTDITQMFTFFDDRKYTIDFAEENEAVVTMSVDGVIMKSHTFIKNATLDTFPVQPWNAGSCANRH